MATATVTAPAAETETPESTPYLLTADDFFQMIEHGIIPVDRRVELWDGRLYETMAKTLPHSGGTANLYAALFRALPPGWCVWPENPILLDTARAPLPDLTVLRGTANDYVARRRHPAAEDVGLVAEVAQTSYRKDVGPRLEGYARALVPVYWVVNLPAYRIEVYSHPEVRDSRGVYTSAQNYGPDDAVPLVLDGREVARIPVRDILPPPEARP